MQPLCPPPSSGASVTAVILAGGRGTRMGGVDKGMQSYRDTTLAAYAARRIAPHVHSVLINANRNLQTYAALGHPVCPDVEQTFQGPLAGFLAGLIRCPTPYLLTLPCDTPGFPEDLAEALLAALAGTDAQVAMAAQDARVEPAFCLMKVQLRESLRTFMREGGRKILQWTAQQRTTVVNFEATRYAGCFANANTVQELAQLRRHAQAAAPDYDSGGSLLKRSAS